MPGKGSRRLARAGRGAARLWIATALVAVASEAAGDEKCGGALPGAASSAGVARLQPAPSPGPLSSEEKFRSYFRSTFGPAALARSAAVAGLNQARNRQVKWGQGAEGYARRFGSRFAQHTIRRTLMFGVGVALHEDPRYFRSSRTGFLPRLADASVQTVVVCRDDGTRAPAFARLSGAFGASLLSRTWHPEPERSVANGLRSGAGSLGFDLATRVLQEFWPDIRRVVLRR